MLLFRRWPEFVSIWRASQRKTQTLLSSRDWCPHLFLCAGVSRGHVRQQVSVQVRHSLAGTSVIEAIVGKSTELLQRHEIHNQGFAEDIIMQHAGDENLVQGNVVESHEVCSDDLNSQYDAAQKVTNLEGSIVAAASCVISFLQIRLINSSAMRWSHVQLAAVRDRARIPLGTCLQSLCRSDQHPAPAALVCNT